MPQSFFDEIKSFDSKNKIEFYFDNFYISELLPIECETRERNMLLKKMGKGWLIQLDVDEYVYDFSKVAKYLKKYGSTDKDKLAHYNGGNRALESSEHCPGRKKYECPWDAAGYYNRNNPNGAPLKTLEKQSDINVGFSETRFYVINILNMMAAMR